MKIVQGNWITSAKCSYDWNKHQFDWKFFNHYFMICQYIYCISTVIMECLVGGKGFWSWKSWIRSYTIKEQDTVRSYFIVFTSVYTYIFTHIFIYRYINISTLLLFAFLNVSHISSFFAKYPDTPFSQTQPCLLLILGSVECYCQCIILICWLYASIWMMTPGNSCVDAGQLVMLAARKNMKWTVSHACIDNWLVFACGTYHMFIV